MLTKFVSIGSYSPEVRTFGTLITSSLIGERAKRARHSQVCSIENRIYIYTRNVLLSAQMGERASVVLICIITSRYNELK